MKFELTQKNQQIPDKMLLDDLRRVAANLKKTTVTKRDYLRHGKHDQQTVAKRFGGWLQALKHAGLSDKRREVLSAEGCSDELTRVASKLGTDSVSLAEFRRHGHFSERPFIRIFGTWASAVAAAGLRPSASYHPRVSDGMYFENLERVWMALGRQPRYSEIAKPLSAYSAHAYEHRFGSWRKALESFVAFVNKDESDISMHPGGETPSSTPSSPAQVLVPVRPARVHRTPRQPSLRLKFLVMRRDNFKCRLTGRSPATDPRVILEVDHIVPWEKGGETVLDNLQTCAKDINIGKSNLDMQEIGQPATSQP